MKKMICVIVSLCLALSLAACGSNAQEPVSIDLEALYASYEQYLPEMFYPDEATLLNFLGIRTENCARYKVAICAEGLRADEVWLIEAADDVSLEVLTALAETRIQSKLDETETYAPDQYLVVQEAVILTNGRYIALIISPDVDAMQAAFEAAFQ